MYSPETQSRMAHLRAKCADGSITEAELAEGVRLMRADRFSAVTAAQAAARGKGKRTKAPVNVDSLFADLDKL